MMRLVVELGWCAFHGYFVLGSEGCICCSAGSVPKPGLSVRSPGYGPHQVVGTDLAVRVREGGEAEAWRASRSD